MSSNSTAPRYRAWVGAAASAAAVAAVVVVADKQTAVQVDAGTEVLSVEHDGIRALSYRTGTMALTARRSGENGSFALEVAYSDGRPVQRCMAARDLAGLLSGLVKITAKRQLTPQQAAAEFPAQLGTLVLEDRIPSEPIEPIVVRATRDGSRVAVALKDATVETTMAPAAFAKLEQGCAALAVK